MSNTITLEDQFEHDICTGLEAGGWLYSGSGAPDPDWDSALALHKADVLWWLQKRYADQFRKVIPDDWSGAQRQVAECQLLTRLAKVLDTKPVVDPATFKERNGLLGVLRSGFNYVAPGRPSATFGPMVEFPPENPLVVSSQEWFNDNRLRVIRQVRFNPETNSTIDLVLLVNGIPVITMELKTDHTQQAKDAVAQYRTDRMPTKKTPLLQPGRCLVHFVVSNQQVLMTTALKGAETRFIPFDKGNNGHAGNSPSATGSPTDYLWREVLAKAGLVKILNSFAMRETNGALVFPRYHQLRAVENIVADVKRKSAGGRYLVAHSAGSGKTKTIAWLAHRLGRLFDAQGDKVFDSVIIVSDRRVLDDQLRRAVNLLGASAGYVVGITDKAGAKSAQLRDALTEGDHIVTVTLQSFPEALKIINDSSDLRSRRWCVIADEAHSSQSGDAATSLRRLLAAQVEPDQDDDLLTSDDLLLASDSAVATANNMTFVALTATPKHRTLQLFGTKDHNGKYWAFDTYTMAQAIEEGFILDVLRRYSTYDMFAQVRDNMTGTDTDIQVDESKAISEIARFVRLHEVAIAQKVEIVIEHFRANVAGSLDGRAKAMVVTSSREQAVRWSLAMNDYLSKRGYHDMKAFVAFSGSITVDEQEYTEPSMNGVSEKGLPRHFREDEEARVLIVADKYQTGYDEPLLCAMYVDKRLSGIAAVQTLSRLNRTAPDKPLPIVLDFVNDPAMIQRSFAEYYTDAYISQETDPNALYALADRLDLAGYYTEQQMRDISETYLTASDGEGLQPVLAQVVTKWKVALDNAKLKADRDKVLAFRSDARAYRHAWDFLSQIVDYQDPNLHRRAILAGLLIRNLHVDALIETIDTSSVELTGLATVATEVDADHAIDEIEAHELKTPIYDGERALGVGGTPEQVALAEAVDKVNELFGASGLDLSADSGDVWTKSVWGVLAQDVEVSAMGEENSADQLRASPKFKDKINDAIVQAMSDSQNMGEAAMTNTELNDQVVAAFAKVVATLYSKDSEQ
ncbi:type I restriction endonuclease subunit R [Kocuria marina subsp. indica]|uniref:type I restriction endonuclease subunit R n=1 Tax=Kocuria marina TaxID=223184 RepID=UPI000EF1BE65|nr:type I restriction endonuclease [Kocuria indica]RLP57323.1 type I restriction endonuclease subunit R [Kocuria indica]